MNLQILMLTVSSSAHSDDLELVETPKKPHQVGLLKTEFNPKNPKPDKTHWVGLLGEKWVF